MKVVNEDSPRRCIRNVKVGEEVRFFEFINAYECEIGDRTKIGSFVEIQRNCKIGSDCKISSHSFLCEGVAIGNGVFVGHNVSFINDKYPKAINRDGTMQTDRDWVCVPTCVEDGVSIGTSVTILCGVVIGKGAIVGAGSVVTKDVPPGVIVAGNPARPVRTMKTEAP